MQKFIFLAVFLSAFSAFSSADQEAVAKLVSDFENEPLVGEVQKNALRYAHVHPEIVDSWLGRVRLAPWAPKFSTTGGRDFDKDISFRQKNGELETSYNKGSVNWKIGLRAEWSFSDLIFNHEEIYIARESVRQSLLRQEIVESVTKAYFKRRSLQVKQKMNFKATKQQMIDRQINMQELTAELDGFTGGWFSDQVNRLKK